MINGLFRIKNVRHYTGYSIYILLSILPAQLFCQLKLPTSTKNITDVAPTQPSLALVNYNAMQYPHNFLDTASVESIYEFINKTPDSDLQLIEDMGEAAMRSFYSTYGYSEADADGDGHRSAESGGDDCNDFDPYEHPMSNERCSGYELWQGEYGQKYLLLWRLHDEDCNPYTIAREMPGKDGDMDGDGQTSCKCVNEAFYNITTPLFLITDKGYALNFSPSKTHPGKFVFSGVDCDDNDWVIGRNVQTCVGQDSVRVCENGEWITLKCEKCYKQPNGTGVVVY